MTDLSILDAYLGGICNAETPSGCLDENVVCKDSVCQCIVEFSDINGTCKAGKSPINDAETRLSGHLFFLFIPCHLKQISPKNREDAEAHASYE